MYNVDDRDRVVELTDLPPSRVGAPCPMFLADEGANVRKVSDGGPCALVSFKHPYAHMFGPPGEEAIEGHPLASRGLEPFSVFEVQDSSWIRKLMEMDSVHPCYSPNLFASYKHFIFTFHDSTFECVAEGFELAVFEGSVFSVLRASWADEYAPPSLHFKV